MLVSASARAHQAGVVPVKYENWSSSQNLSLGYQSEVAFQRAVRHRGPLTCFVNCPCCVDIDWHLQVSLLGIHPAIIAVQKRITVFV